MTVPQVKEVGPDATNRVQVFEAGDYVGSMTLEDHTRGITFDGKDLLVGVDTFRHVGDPVEAEVTDEWPLDKLPFEKLTQVQYDARVANGTIIDNRIYLIVG